MNLRLKRQRSKKVTLADQSANRSAERIQTLITKLALNSAGAVKDPVVLRALVSKLELQRELVLKAPRHANLRGKGRVSPQVALPSVGKTALQLRRASLKTAMSGAVRHLQSVKQMLAAERALSA